MKKLFIISFSLVVSLKVIGQTDLTFYHLRGLTPQSSINNASFFPDAEFYISMPGISGLNTKLNSEISYNQLMRPVAGTDSVKVDLQGALSRLKEGDNLRFQGDVSLFQFGLRSGHRAFTLFANLRYSGGFNYPVNFLNYFVYGNGNFIGEQVEERQLKGGGIAYHEIGLGYSQDMTVLTDRTLRIGGRVKYLTGIANVSVDKNASITMFTDPSSFDINVQFNNAIVRTAGLNELEGDNASSYIVGFGSNKNTGFAIDLGAEMQITEKLSGSFALNDLGFINWEQDVESHTFQNQVTLGGFDDVNDIDISEALEDSLDVWTESSTESNSFRSPVGARTYLGANYQLSKNGSVSGTIAYNRFSYNASEIGFGVGYTHEFAKILTLSSSVSKDQSRPVRLGGGFGLRVGSLQLYGAFDDVLNAAKSVSDASGLDARFGLNIIIGRNNSERKEIQKKEKEELSPFPPEYDLDHLNDNSRDN